MRLALGITCKRESKPPMCPRAAGTGNDVLGILPGGEDKVMCDISHGLQMPCHHMSFVHVVHSNKPHFSALYVSKLFTVAEIHKA